MAMAATGVVGSLYTPDQLVLAGQGRRLGGFVLDVILQVLTLWIGWLVWAAIVAERGQTPGKQLLGMYVIRENGTRAGGAFTFYIRESLVKTTLFGFVLGTITFGIVPVIAAAWCLWDRERQCLWDKVSHTLVAEAPAGFRPLTANEMVAVLRDGGDPPGLHPLQSAPARDDTRSRLAELDSLYQAREITRDEYDERRRRILDSV